MLKRLLITGLLAASGALFGFTPAAHAATGIPSECGYSVHCIVNYYYNAAMTQPSGTLSLPCSGAVFTSGDVDTPYYIVHELSTCPGHSPAR